MCTLSEAYDLSSYDKGDYEIEFVLSDEVLVGDFVL
jgi:hypothetical protein